MRIEPSSPLYNIPREISPKQRLIFEGLRYTINMIFNSWNLLNYDLSNLSKFQNVEISKYQAFQNSWTIIDNLDRLKSLLEQIETTGPKTFITKLGEVREMRNTYHHIYDRIDSSIVINYPLVGVLNWTYIESENPKSIHVFTLASGSNIEDRYFPLINPLGQHIDWPIGRVTLSSIIQERKSPSPKVFKIEISEYILATNNFVESLETQLNEIFSKINSSLPTVSQDLLKKVTIDINGA